MLEQEKFRKYHLKKKIDSFTTRLNEDERAMLEKCKAILGENKDSTAYKDVFKIGFNVLHSSLVKQTITTLFKKKAQNKPVDIDKIG